MLSRECVPNCAFESVVLATQCDGQLLARQLFEFRSHESPRNILDNAPIVISIQFAQSDNTVIEKDFHNAFWQLIELNRPRFPAGNR